MQQPKLIGVCLSTLYDEDRFNFIKELNKYAVNNGFRLFVFNSGNDLYEQNNKTTKGAASIFSLIPYEKLSAIIVCPNFIHNEKIINNIIKKSHENSVPVISIDKEIEGCVAFSFTYADVFESLCRHVIEYHGVKRVNIITGLKGNDYSEERLAVFRKVLEENNIPFDEKNVGYGCFMPEQTSDVLKKWFETEKRELPEAIICANDIMAVTTSTFLQKKGFKIPDDCIVTGFDGIEQSRYHLPKLTTCRQDYDKMGRLIVEKILALENGETAEGSYRVGFKIKYSQSCGCKKVIDINVNLAIQTLIDRMRLSNERNSMMCSMQSEISKMSDIRELPQILIDKFRFHTTVLAINNDVFEAAESGLSREDESRFGKNCKYTSSAVFME